MLVLRIPIDLCKDSEPEILDLLEALLTEEEQDVELHCAGYGGEVIYASMIINAMAACQTSVTLVADSDCYSCHAAIALSNVSKDIKMAPVGVNFMLHDHQISTGETGSHMVSELCNTRKQESIRFFKQIGILDLMTKKEKAEFVYNKAIYWSSDEAAKRLFLRDVKDVPKIENKS